jgi:hypothetical protein
MPQLFSWWRNGVPLPPEVVAAEDGARKFQAEIEACEKAQWLSIVKKKTVEQEQAREQANCLRR